MMWPFPAVQGFTAYFRSVREAQTKTQMLKSLMGNYFVTLAWNGVFIYDPITQSKKLFEKICLQFL